MLLSFFLLLSLFLPSFLHFPEKYTFNVELEGTRIAKLPHSIPSEAPNVHWQVESNPVSSKGE